MWQMHLMGLVKGHLKIAHFQRCNCYTMDLFLRFLLKPSERSEFAQSSCQDSPRLLVYLWMTDHHKS